MVYPWKGDIGFPTRMVRLRTEDVCLLETHPNEPCRVGRRESSRSLSPVEVANDVITHAEAVNGSVIALFCFRPEQAIAGARQSGARWKAKPALGPLDGVPMTVKDSVAMVGWPYFHGIGAKGSLPLSNYDSRQPLPFAKPAR